jgi:hypothetical protein
VEAHADEDGDTPSSVAAFADADARRWWTPDRAPPSGSPPTTTAPHCSLTRPTN